jgi:hypothetical protein
MTNVLILPEESDSYRALSGDKQSTGRTPGQALDALRSQLTEDEAGTLVIVQGHKPDRFFNMAQQERLDELMRLRERGELSAEDEIELESLIEVELLGAQVRAEALSDAVGREVSPSPTLTLEDACDLYELLQKIVVDAPDEESTARREARETMVRLQSKFRRKRPASIR